MTVLVVGADKIQSFVPKLVAMGAEEIIHWDARNVRVSKNKIPESTELVLFCTDYLHHSAAKAIKKKVKSRGLPAIYCRRAWSDIGPEVGQAISDLKDREKGRCGCTGCKTCRCKQGLQ